MDDNNLRRTVAGLQARVKQLELAVKKFESPITEETDEFPTRAGLDLTTADIEKDIVAASTFLSNCYDSVELNRFCVGTWPSPENTPNSMCIHGMLSNTDGVPLEFNRLVVFPTMIKAQVPFSSVSTEPNAERPQYQTWFTTMTTCSSHLVQFTPNKDNIHEIITASFLAGRGVDNVHIIENGFSALYLGTTKLGPTNLVGPAHFPSMRERITEAHEIFSFLSPHSKKYNRFEEFVNKVLVKNPSVLKKPIPSDVEERRQRWNYALTEKKPKTDYGLMVMAAFFKGTQSPVHGELSLPIQMQTLENGEEWLGMCSMLDTIASVKGPTDRTEAENPMRNALVYLSYF